MRYYQTRTFSKGSIIIRPKNVKAEIGIINYPDRNRFELKAYSGKRNKPDMYCLYRSSEERDRAITNYLNGLSASVSFKAEMRAKRTLTVNPLEVGTILYSSWGYDQTNVDFFQVTEVKGSYVTVRRIGSELAEGGKASGMSSNVTAVKDSFIENREPLRRKVLTHNNGQTVSIKIDHDYAYVWDGRPLYSSWYA